MAGLVSKKKLILVVQFFSKKKLFLTILIAMNNLVHFALNDLLSFDCPMKTKSWEKMQYTDCLEPPYKLTIFVPLLSTVTNCL